MTPTDVDWRRVLERADAKAASDPDPIGVLVQAVEAQLQQGRQGDATQLVVEALNADRRRLAKSLEETLGQRDTARAEVERLKERVDELRIKLAQAGRPPAVEHKHLYEMDAKGRPRTCKCGKPWPGKRGRGAVT